MINYPNYDATEKIEISDALRRASAPLTLSTGNATPQPPQATPVRPHGPITPIPATPLDCYIQHEKIKHEFRADMRLLYLSIAVIAAAFTVVWRLFH